MIAAGLEARLTCVDPRVLVRAVLAGRRFDLDLLDDFRRTSTRAANAASFTPACSPGRCSRRGSRRLGRSSSAKGSCLRIWNFGLPLLHSSGEVEHIDHSQRDAEQVIHDCCASDGSRIPGYARRASSGPAVNST